MVSRLYVFRRKVLSSTKINDTCLFHAQCRQREQKAGMLLQKQVPCSSRTCPEDYEYSSTEKDFLLVSNINLMTSVKIKRNTAICCSL